MSIPGIYSFCLVTFGDEYSRQALPEDVASNSDILLHLGATAERHS